MEPTVLVGDTRSHKLIEELRRLRWGRIWIEERPRPYPGEPWGLDNGAFTAWKRGLEWDGDAYARRLERALGIGRKPYLAVLPDIVAGGERSLALSCEWRKRLPTDWGWYLAVQDGQTFGAVRDAIMRCHPLAGLFLGGSDALKLQAHDWCDFAHHHGLRFHFARAGTVYKAQFALRIGADSLDSSFPLWTMRRFWRFVQVIQGRGPQVALFTEGALP